MNLKMMKLLSRLLQSDREAGKTKWDAAGCLLLALLTVLLCALSSNAVFTVSIIAAEFVRLSFRSVRVMAHVLKTVALAVLASAVFMLPAVFLGSPASFGTVTMKVMESVLVLTMLNEDVTWKDLTAAMGQLRFPDVFVLTLDMTMRFLYLLGRFSQSVLEAVSLRRVGEENWKNAGTGGVLGNTFLKAQEMSRGTGEAMQCRCWNGSYAGHRGKEKRGLFPAVIFVLLVAAEIFWFAVTQMWMKA